MLKNIATEIAAEFGLQLRDEFAAELVARKASRRFSAWQNLVFNNLESRNHNSDRAFEFLEKAFRLVATKIAAPTT